MDGFSFPFRFINGRAVKTPISSEAYKAQLIASAMYTQVGELPFTPDYGSRVAAFSNLDVGDFLSTVSAYIKGVSISSVNGQVNPDQTISLSIDYKMIED